LPVTKNADADPMTLVSETTKASEIDPDPSLLISVVGPVRASVARRVVRLRSRKCRAVLGYLALSETRQETRERLVGLLWSESDEEKARASLRQILHELGEALAEAGYQGLVRERLHVALAGDGDSTDYRDILAMAETRQVHPRLLETAALSETLLQDLDDLDAAFRVWLLAKRQNFHDSLLRALEGGLRDTTADVRIRRQIAQAILNLDPTHEEACRAFMRLCAEDGDVGSALRAYSALWNLLDEEYGMEPSTPTQQLVAAIKQGTIEAPPPAPIYMRTEYAGVAEFLPEVNSLAPLGAGSAPAARLALLIEPFGMNGIAPESLHLVGGFRFDLIACLVRFREWFVMDGGTLPPEEELGVRVSGAYCVAATAYQAGDAMNLVLTLREQGTGIHVWSDRFLLALSNWFEAQQHIVRQIAISLNVQVSMGRLGRQAAEPAVSLAAYDLWLRGQAEFSRFRPQTWKRAAELYTEAIEQAPNFAPGYSSLVQLNNIVHFVHPGMRRDPVRAQRIVDLARKAVELDPMDSRSQLCLGWSYSMVKSYAQAAMHMELACALNPNDSWTLISTALCLSYCGNVPKGADLAAQSLRLTLTPSLLHWAYQVQIAFLRHDYAEAVDAADRAQDVMMGMVAWRAAALWHLGRTEEAAQTARRFINLIRSNWFGDGPPTDEAIGRWLLHMFPIRYASDWQRLRDGVAGAGIPPGDAVHHDW
jgi:DNA-binding SARP family transcriptional activator/tetratricopeptide (TPR) repeat protein